MLWKKDTVSFYCVIIGLRTNTILGLKITLGRTKIGENRDSVEVLAPITIFPISLYINLRISNEFVSNSFFLAPIIRQMGNSTVSINTTIFFFFPTRS